MVSGCLRNRLMVCAALALAAAAAQAAPKYEANWTSLDKRPIPAWFNEAKFGVFVCWGPYSVPAWVDQGYPEWYGWHMQYPDSPVAKFHLKNYGAQFKYEDFAPLLKAELWDPDFWADLFVKSGARYVVTTAKFHDGYCLWPCAGAEKRADQAVEQHGGRAAPRPVGRIDGGGPKTRAQNGRLLLALRMVAPALARPGQTRATSSSNTCIRNSRNW